MDEDWVCEGEFYCPIHGCQGQQIRRWRYNLLRLSRWTHGEGEAMLELSDQELARGTVVQNTLRIRDWAQAIHDYEGATDDRDR